MKIVIAAIALAFGISAAQAGTECVTYRGKTVCCTSSGNWTNCY